MISNCCQENPSLYLFYEVSFFWGCSLFLQIYHTTKELPLLRFFCTYCSARWSSELDALFLLPYSCGRSTRYSDTLHDFSASIPRFYKDVCVSSFFSCAARFWNYTLTKCFCLTHDLEALSLELVDLLSLGSSETAFLFAFNLFYLLFAATACLVVVFHSYWTESKLKKQESKYSFRKCNSALWKTNVSVPVSYPRNICE